MFFSNGMFLPSFRNLFEYYSRANGSILAHKIKIGPSGTLPGLFVRANKSLDKNLENAKFFVILVFFSRNVDPDGDHIGGTVPGGTP